MSNCLRRSSCISFILSISSFKLACACAAAVAASLAFFIEPPRFPGDRAAFSLACASTSARRDSVLFDSEATFFESAAICVDRRSSASFNWETAVPRSEVISVDVSERRLSRSERRLSRSSLSCCKNFFVSATAFFRSSTRSSKTDIAHTLPVHAAGGTLDG